MNYLLEFVNWTTLPKSLKMILERRREEQTWKPWPHFGIKTELTKQSFLIICCAISYHFFPSPCRCYYLTIPHLSAADQVNVGTRSFDEDQYCPAATCALPTSLLPSIQRYTGTFLQTFITQYTPTQTCSVGPFTLHLLLQI